MSNSTKPSVIFWIISGIAFLWNLLGCAIYVMTHFIPAEALVKAYTQAGADLFMSKPVWAVSAFAISVFAGLLGSLGLLLRKAWAQYLFILSLIGVIIHDIWGVSAGTLAYVGAFDKFMTVAVVVIAIFLIWFARKKTAKGILT